MSFVDEQSFDSDQHINSGGVSSMNAKFANYYEDDDATQSDILQEMSPNDPFMSPSCEITEEEFLSQEMINEANYMSVVSQYENRSVHNSPHPSDYA